MTAEGELLLCFITTCCIGIPGVLFSLWIMARAFWEGRDDLRRDLRQTWNENLSVAREMKAAAFSGREIVKPKRAPSELTIGDDGELVDADEDDHLSDTKTGGAA